MAYVDLRYIAEDYVIGDTYERMQAASGDDWVDGSLVGGSVWARLMGGNDVINLFTGLNNFVNGNAGNDVINLAASPDGYSDGNILGGRDNDWIIIHEGAVWGVDEGMIINGNKGDDLIENYGKCYQLRGGADNDRIINYGGTCFVWGDRGADTFVPWALNTNGDFGGFMEINDFNPYEGDTLDLSNLGTYNKLHYDANSDGITDTAFSNVNGPLACLVYSNIL